MAVERKTLICKEKMDKSRSVAIDASTHHAAIGDDDEGAYEPPEESPTHLGRDPAAAIQERDTLARLAFCFTQRERTSRAVILVEVPSKGTFYGRLRRSMGRMQVALFAHQSRGAAMLDQA